jgi:hypothetical protein
MLFSATGKGLLSSQKVFERHNLIKNQRVKVKLMQSLKMKQPRYLFILNIYEAV